MLDYLIKRLLILIPTYLGVSLVIWLVMTLAPGEPEAAGGGPDGGMGNVSDLESMNRNVRLFRRQFNLDRPRFFNTWTGLSADEVEEDLRVVLAGVNASSPERFKEAKRALDDWAGYAVPPLVQVLERNADAPWVQALAVRYLRQSAYTYRAVYPAGYRPTTEERAHDKQVDKENRLLNAPDLQLDPLATAYERGHVVKAWQTWFADRSDRWQWSFGEKTRIFLTDTQFGKYWGNLARGDLGLSVKTKEPVLAMIVRRLKYSMSLAVPAFLAAWIMAIFLGVFSATHHNKPIDQGIGVTLFMLYSIPTFVAAILLRKWLAVDLDLFPTEGFESDNAKSELNTWEAFLDVGRHIALPLLCYTYGSLAYISRQARSGMLQVLKADYVRTARAKGLPEKTVIWKHGVRNGMMPIVTLLGTALPVLIAGSVFIETVFNIDGFGKLMVDSILGKDYNVVMGIQLIVAFLTLFGLLLTDLIYAAMDPRISFK